MNRINPSVLDEELARIDARNQLFAWLEERSEAFPELLPNLVNDALENARDPLTLPRLVEWLWDEELREALSKIAEGDLFAIESCLNQLFYSHPVCHEDRVEDLRELDAEQGAMQWRRYRQYEALWKASRQRELS